MAATKPLPKSVTKIKRGEGRGGHNWTDGHGGGGREVGPLSKYVAEWRSDAGVVRRAWRKLVQ